MLSLDDQYGFSLCRRLHIIPLTYGRGIFNLQSNISIVGAARNPMICIKGSDDQIQVNYRPQHVGMLLKL
ncbi:hypothetical protein CS8_002590 [Cupriavidus sp. 8B]